MERVLVVSGTDKGRKYFDEFLANHSIHAAGYASTGAETRRAILEQDFDLVIINTPLKDEFGNDLSVDLCTRTPAGVVLVVKAELYESVSSRVESAGVVVAAKPVNRTLLYQALKVTAAASRRLGTMQAENRKLQKKVHELQVVGRAKCALVQYRHLTEQEAHRFIEKQAMDQRLPRLEVAEDILQVYEDV